MLESPFKARHLSGTLTVIWIDLNWLCQVQHASVQTRHHCMLVHRPAVRIGTFGSQKPQIPQAWQSGQRWISNSETESSFWSHVNKECEEVMVKVWTWCCVLTAVTHNTRDTQTEPSPGCSIFIRLEIKETFPELGQLSAARSCSVTSSNNSVHKTSL